MKKSKVILPIIIPAIISGCQTTSTASSSKDCGYYENNQPEYVLSDSGKQYITNHVKSTNVGSHEPQFKNKKYFDPVINNAFKFSDTSSKKPFYSSLQQDDIFEIDKKLYIYSGYKMVKIITSTCQVFWYERENYARATLSGIRRADGKELNIQDHKFILGKNNLKEFIIPKATIKEDKFKNTIKIIGLYDNGMMFRDWGSIKTRKMNDNSVQLYADVKFLKDWAHLDHAYDEDANRRKLTRIDTDVDCSGVFLGCWLTETIGIDLPISYLQQKTDGFKVKVAGKKELVLNVSSYQVKQILDAIKDFQ